MRNHCAGCDGHRAVIDTNSPIGIGFADCHGCHSCAEKDEEIARLTNKLKDSDRRCAQLSLNLSWLNNQIDKICAVVCPNYIGTWQQRAQQASFETYQLAAATLRVVEAMGKYANFENWQWFTDSRGVQVLRWVGGCHTQDGGDFARIALADPILVALGRE